MTPRTFAMDFIKHWEDGGSTDPNRTHSLDPIDSGNWSGGRQGLGRLIGSNHGVTAAALASYRKVSIDSITRDAMHALALDEAADIALALYYHAPKLDMLPWNRVTASVMDMGWGAGPRQAIKLLQRLAGCADDGCMGPGTVRATDAWLDRRGESEAAAAYGQARNAFYDRIIVLNPANARYRNGWRNRTAYYLPGDKANWWGKAA
jgi:lysozyme family protein